VPADAAQGTANLSCQPSVAGTTPEQEDRCSLFLLSDIPGSSSVGPVYRRLGISWKASWNKRIR
jgi:hypothetical protein